MPNEEEEGERAAALGGSGMKKKIQGGIEKVQPVILVRNDEMMIDTTSTAGSYRKGDDLEREASSYILY